MNPNEAASAMANFRKKRVGHRIAKWARDRLFHLIVTADGERIVPLIGPGGVGKSAVAERVQRALLDMEMSKMLEDSGYLPVLRVQAVTGLDGNYSWKDGFARMLEAGKEPLISRKTTFPKLQLDGRDIGTTQGLLRDEFRRAFESMVKNRRIRWLFLEEGSAIVDEAVSRHPLRQFNILKSLAVGLKMVIIPIGAYDLAGISDANGQLIRREFEVHMRRYLINENAADASSTTVAGDELVSDLEEWSRAVDALVGALPKEVRVEDAVFDDKPSLLIRSVGCVGNFRDWLDRAAVDALVSHSGILSAEVLKANVLPVKKLITLTEEAELGEKMLADEVDATLAHKYGRATIETPTQSSSNGAPAAPQKRPTKRVGVRGPSRDEVGQRRA